ncbi:hypothetical protein EUGRSUZ_B00002 [Eucalyptus grandis]|uniref:Uncharacterized protein n=2 Tax=Eucalyptus grandis TaxID=71139 RepID=A0ACC3LGK4_EUCGR|nr:hypothetical protein EUGRSUZ_B00002 [Eucalyptus grandis]
MFLAEVSRKQGRNSHFFLSFPNELSKVIKNDKIVKDYIVIIQSLFKSFNFHRTMRSPAQATFSALTIGFL